MTSLFQHFSWLLIVVSVDWSSKAFSKKLFRTLRLNGIKSKMPFTFQLIVGSKLMHQTKLQWVLVNVWFPNTISGHGPYSHKSSWASQLVVGFQISQITWDKVRFPIGSTCQVSQIPSFVHCLRNVDVPIRCFKEHNQSRLGCWQSPVSNLHQHWSRLELYLIFELNSLANEWDVQHLLNGGKWAQIYHQSKFICSSTCIVY